jgi:argininosuccinate synthase
MDREVMHLRDSQIPRYAQLVYNGFWFSPEMEVLQGMIDSTQKNVTGDGAPGVVQGQLHGLGRKSPTPCTVKTSPPSRTMMFTARRMPKGLSGSTRCGCGFANDGKKGRW